jgi:hypothetical protein
MGMSAFDKAVQFPFGSIGAVSRNNELIEEAPERNL